MIHGVGRDAARVAAAIVARGDRGSRASADSRPPSSVREAGSSRRVA
jgi:hypothetical protein